MVFSVYNRDSSSSISFILPFWLSQEKHVTESKAPDAIAWGTYRPGVLFWKIFAGCISAWVTNGDLYSFFSNNMIDATCTIVHDLPCLLENERTPQPRMEALGKEFFEWRKHFCHRCFWWEMEAYFVTMKRWTIKRWRRFCYLLGRCDKRNIVDKRWSFDLKVVYAENDSNRFSKKKAPTISLC